MLVPYFQNVAVYRKRGEDKALKIFLFLEGRVCEFFFRLATKNSKITVSNFSVVKMAFIEEMKSKSNCNM